MPIRVQIERVGAYEQYPDAKIYDLLITNTQEKVAGMLRYNVEDRINGDKADVFHEPGTGVEALVAGALEVIR